MFALFILAARRARGATGEQLFAGLMQAVLLLQEIEIEMANVVTRRDGSAPFGFLWANDFDALRQIDALQGDLWI